MRNGTIKKTTLVATLLATFALVLSLAACSGTEAPQDSAGSDAQVSSQEATADTEVVEEGPSEPEAVEEEAVEEEAVEEEVAEEEAAEDQSRAAPRATAADLALPEDGSYTSKDEVAWYLHTYGHLPDNFVTKKEAEQAGWKTQGLTIDEACPGKSLGGSHFGNYEGLLPDAPGRKWYECDIDYRGGKSRGAKRLVYSNDGLIYYTDDHYNSFERIY